MTGGSLGVRRGAPSPGRGREAWLTARLAVPLALASVAPNLIGTIGLAFLGQLGGGELAAGALAFGLFTLCVTVAGGLDAAAMSLVANAFGARLGAPAKVLALMRQAMAASVLASGVIIICLQWTHPVLLRLGQAPDIAARAGEGMAVLAWSILPFGLSQVLRAGLSARGQVGMTVAASLVAIVSQVLLCWLLVAGGLFALDGLTAAGIATFGSSTILLLAMLACFHRDPVLRRLGLVRRHWRFDWRQHLALWRMVAPIALLLLFESAIFYTAMVAIGRYGVVQLAAHSIAIQIVAIAFKIPFALGQAATIRVAGALGAGDFRRARRAGWIAFALAMMSASGTSLLMIAQPHMLIGPFLDAADPLSAVISAEARTLLLCAGIFQFSDAAQAVAAGMLRGLRDVTVPMVVAGLGYWLVGLPAGLLLADYWGLQALGVWVGLTVGLTTVALMLVARWGFGIGKLVADQAVPTSVSGTMAGGRRTRA